MLITSCTFDSSARANATRYGYASSDKMCFNFLQYYPAMTNITYLVS